MAHIARPLSLWTAAQSRPFSMLAKQRCSIHQRTYPSLGTLHNNTPSAKSDGDRCFHSSPPTLLRKRKKKYWGRKKKMPPSKFTMIAEPPKEATPAEEEITLDYLSHTGSSYVYIAKAAITDEERGGYHIDPIFLFSDHSAIAAFNEEHPHKPKRYFVPESYRQCHLKYFPPDSFPKQELPDDDIPEVALVGSGRHSLIKAIQLRLLEADGNKSTQILANDLNRDMKSLKNAQINYFGTMPNDKRKKNADKPKIYIVDLPLLDNESGANIEEVSTSLEGTQHFIRTRGSASIEREIISQNKDAFSAGTITRKTPPLKRVYILISSKLSEPRETDRSMMEWCDEHSIPYTVVLTNIDDSLRKHCEHFTNRLMKHYQSMLSNKEYREERDGSVFMDPVIYWTNARDGLGIDEILSSIEGAMLYGWDSYSQEEEDEEDEFKHYVPDDPFELTHHTDRIIDGKEGLDIAEVCKRHRWKLRVTDPDEVRKSANWSAWKWGGHGKDGPPQ